MRGKREAPKEKPGKVPTSHIIAVGILVVDGMATFAVLALCALAIWRNFLGALPFLTTLIGALQAATAIVLQGYFSKSKAENTKGGIVYDTAIGVSESDTGDL